MREAIDYALDVFGVVYRTGRPAQGGEQNGNWECVELGYRRLQRANTEKPNDICNHDPEKSPDRLYCGKCGETL